MNFRLSPTFECEEEVELGQVKTLIQEHSQVDVLDKENMPCNHPAPVAQNPFMTPVHNSFQKLSLKQTEAEPEFERKGKSMFPVVNKGKFLDFRNFIFEFGQRLIFRF